MLLQSAAIVAKTDDKITACVKEICLLDVERKVRKKTLSSETFCFPEERLLSL